MLSNFEYDSATGLLLKQNYGNGDCINYSYDNLDRLSYKMYNGDGNRKLSYSYGRDGNIASSFDSATGEKQYSVTTLQTVRSVKKHMWVQRFLRH